MEAANRGKEAGNGIASRLEEVLSKLEETLSRLEYLPFTIKSALFSHE